MNQFIATLQIIGVNPYIELPMEILNELFKKCGKNIGPINVFGTVNGKTFKQTLVKFRGEYRFYINTKMLPLSPKRIGEKLEISIDYDPSDRSISLHPELEKAFHHCAEAEEAYSRLSMSRKNEINRYLISLKSDHSLTKNVQKAIEFLLGKSSFVGRNKPK